MRRAAASACAILAAGLIATGCGGGHKSADRTGGSSTPAAPGPIIGGPGTPASPLSSADQRAATGAARDFLRGYLPYLYGRARAQTVRPVSPTVARTLRASRGRVTPAQRRRTPRATELTVTGQTSRSAIASTTVADGGPAPYHLSFTLERRGRTWLVSALGND